MSGFFSFISRACGFTGNPDQTIASDDDWADDNPRQTLLREQLEYYFSGVNLERDANFLAEIGRSSTGQVSIDYILACNRVKQLHATADDVLQAAASSPYLTADPRSRTISSRSPFVSDPNRGSRTLRVTGFSANVPQSAQLQFFESIFPGAVARVNLVRTVDRDGQFVYSGTSIVELDDPDLASQAVENGIEYGTGLLEVELLSGYQEKTKKKAQAPPPKRPPKNSRKR
jgi:hypothetical protein